MKKLLIISTIIVFTTSIFIVSCEKDPTSSSKNTEPTASFSVEPTSGTTSTTFTFDASSSSDNEDATSALKVRWDWTNNGSYDTNWSTDKTTTHQYSTAGTYTVKLEVKDTGGLTDTYTKTVSVGQSNTAPTASFTVIYVSLELMSSDETIKSAKVGFPSVCKSGSCAFASVKALKSVASTW